MIIARRSDDYKQEEVTEELNNNIKRMRLKQIMQESLNDALNYKNFINKTQILEEKMFAQKYIDVKFWLNTALNSILGS